MLALDADAPKPPTYPFVNQTIQRAIFRQNLTRRQFPSVFSSALSSDYPVASDCHRRSFASVSGYLRIRIGTRKRENGESRIFFTKLEKHTKSGV